MTLQTALFVLVVLLQAADIATTVADLRSGASERNGLIAQLQSVFGLTGGTLLAKVAILCAFFWYSGGIEAVPVYAYLIMVAMYVIIVANNVRVYRRLHGLD